MSISILIEKEKNEINYNIRSFRISFSETGSSSTDKIIEKFVLDEEKRNKKY